MSNAVLLEHFPLLDEHGNETEDKIASVAINQPKTANAMSSEILVSIAEIFESISHDPTVRAVILQSEGKHFSAGANLKWMQDSAKLGYDKNFDEAKKLSAMFEAISNLPIPTVAVVKGASYGGAIGLIAACDYAIASESAMFCLSEAKIGLLPAVILPYLSRKMLPGSLRRLTLTAQVFNADTAKTCGLVEEIVHMDNMEATLQQEIQFLIAASSDSQKAYKQLQHEVDQHQAQQGDYTANSIATIRASTSGQEGLASFFEKRKPSWFRQIPNGSELFKKPD